MSSISPISVLFSSDGYEIAQVIGATVISGTRSILVSGVDSSGNAHAHAMDTNGNQIVIGNGIAGTSITTGVVGIQGVSGGVAVPISGSVSLTGSPTVSLAAGTSVTITGTTTISGAVTVSGTVASTQSGAWTTSVTQATAANLNATVVQSGSWTVAATQSGTWTTTDSSDGPVSAGTAATKAGLIAGVYNSTLPTLTNGQQVATQVDSSGRLILGTSAAVIGSVAQSGSWTTTISGTTTVSGTVSISGTPSVTVASGAITANVGTTGGLALDATLSGGSQKSQIVSSTGTPAVIKASAPLSSDAAMVVSISPLSPITTTNNKSTSGVITSIAASTTSTTLLAANTARQAALLFNGTTGTAYIAYSATASTSAYTLTLFKGAMQEVTQDYCGPISAVFSSGSTGNFLVTELS